MLLTGHLGELFSHSTRGFSQPSSLAKLNTAPIYGMDFQRRSCRALPPIPCHCRRRNRWVFRFTNQQRFSLSLERGNAVHCYYGRFESPVGVAKSIQSVASKPFTPSARKIYLVSAAIVADGVHYVLRRRSKRSGDYRACGADGYLGMGRAISNLHLHRKQGSRRLRLSACRTMESDFVFSIAARAQSGRIPCHRFHQRSRLVTDSWPGE